ncbi:hypothetical protein B0H17DRAFT_1099100 [Mycena rosella]|uniref:Arrestin-like N-terminal domain-containing protein n=1 Tax=Mycena rosella TaxID=1033263 RepID=A0AAD7G1C0_MYCRO|nr:hypothetical protein B0H17DRAFT_1099100 [Mycena rosella]
MALNIATSHTDGPVTLHFQNRLTRVAGETIRGRVDLNVALAQEENLEHLRIKFRGTIRTQITTSNGNSTVDHNQTVVLIHTNLPLWSQGIAFPEPGSHILSCSFQFLLPESLPPSFHCWGWHRNATISYSLEVVGERVGFFRMNRRIRRPLSVIPAASQSQLLAKESLKQGWNGPWRDYICQEQKLRQGIWGDYSHARVKLKMPTMSSFPIATAIPFGLHIETKTKTMHISDSPVDKHGKPLFPALPALSSDVKLALHRRTEIRVRNRTRQVEDIFDLKGSLGDVTRVASVRQVVDEPEWIPTPGTTDEKGRGIWRRAVHFESEVSIPYAPTCSTETVDWQYDLRFVVPFPGIGNDLVLDVPIQLDPGSACPPPPVGTPGSSSITYADILPAGPPPLLDLPPSYWAGDHHAWDLDEKN